MLASSRLSRRVHLGRWTARTPVVLLGLAGAAVALVGLFRPWVTAVATDPVLGRAALSATGPELAVSALGAALVAVAGLLAITLAGRVIRIPVMIAVAAAGLLGILATASVLRDPSGAAVAKAAQTLGRSGAHATSGEVTGSLTPWPWLTLTGFLLVAVSTCLAMGFGKNWERTSVRYDAPDVETSRRLTGQPRGSSRRAVTSRAAPGEDDGATRAQQGRTDDSVWDRLSAGEDPTVDSPGAEDADEGADGPSR